MGGKWLELSCEPHENLPTLLLDFSQAIASPPKKPEASTATEWQLGQTLDKTVPSASLVHLVSWRKRIWGLSFWIMFLIILCFAGLLSPLTFHEMSFMAYYLQVVFKTELTWGNVSIPPKFPLMWWFVANLVSSPFFWTLLWPLGCPNDYRAKSLASFVAIPWIRPPQEFRFTEDWFFHIPLFYRHPQVLEDQALLDQDFQSHLPYDWSGYFMDFLCG